LTHHFDVGDFARLNALVSEVSNGRSDTSRGTTIIRFLPGNKSRRCYQRCQPLHMTIGAISEQLAP
jgi:hypothetical protein